MKFAGSETGAPAGRMLKKLLGNPVFQFLIGQTIGFYMLLVGWTTRWRSVNRPRSSASGPKAAG